METSTPIRPLSGSPPRSQSSTWYLTSGPNREYVRQKLLRLAVPEVKLLLDYESRQGLIKGVFYNMD